MVDIDVNSLLHLVEAAATSPRQVADVVDISSIAGRWVIPGAAVYNATKVGVTATTEAWRPEYTRRNVRFSVVEPGLVEPSFRATPVRRRRTAARRRNRHPPHRPGLNRCAERYFSRREGASTVDLRQLSRRSLITTDCVTSYTRKRAREHGWAMRISRRTP
ncbi:MAG: hypothetical protein QOI78_5635 [Actinomycetota bacterium]|jgi:NAD(P)-dependent dehydrogenase (short-subunit alcohol dehydrogenase family)|nr:hypothetical protein [Actinomycetota bacterium]